MPKVISDIAQKSARPPAAPLYVFKRFLRLFFGKMPYSNRKIEIFGSPAGLARDAAVIQKPPSPGKKVSKNKFSKKSWSQRSLPGQKKNLEKKWSIPGGSTVRRKKSQKKSRKKSGPFLGEARCAEKIYKKNLEKKVVPSWKKHGAQKKIFF